MSSSQIERKNLLKMKKENLIKKITICNGFNLKFSREMLICILNIFILNYIPTTK